MIVQLSNSARQDGDLAALARQLRILAVQGDAGLVSMRVTTTEAREIAAALDARAARRVAGVTRPSDAPARPASDPFVLALAAVGMLAVTLGVMALPLLWVTL